MAKELIMSAPSVEEAKEKIAAAFGLAPEEITFEVLVQPQKKTLGLFGGVDAQVKGTANVSAAQVAKQFLLDVFKEMGVADVAVNIEEKADACVLSVEGEDLGFVIGRRGETLDALQYLTGLIANRVDNSYARINIDIGNYRAKREKTLISLAKRMGAQAARTGRRTSLEPMNPYERRIIHTAIQEVEGATSWSVGNDADRHVIIGPSDDNPVKAQRASRRRNRRRNDRAENNSAERNERTVAADRPARGEAEGTVAAGRPVRQFVPRSNPLPMADGATPPQKTESEKERSAFLYGRIDL